MLRSKIDNNKLLCEIESLYAQISLARLPGELREQLSACRSLAPIADLMTKLIEADRGDLITVGNLNLWSEDTARADHLNSLVQELILSQKMSLLTQAHMLTLCRMSEGRDGLMICVNELRCAQKEALLTTDSFQFMLENPNLLQCVAAMVRSLRLVCRSGELITEKRFNQLFYATDAALLLLRVLGHLTFLKQQEWVKENIEILMSDRAALEKTHSSLIWLQHFGIDYLVNSRFLTAYLTENQPSDLMSAVMIARLCYNYHLELGLEQYVAIFSHENLAEAYVQLNDSVEMSGSLSLAMLKTVLELSAWAPRSTITFSQPQEGPDSKERQVSRIGNHA